MDPYKVLPPYHRQMQRLILVDSDPGSNLFDYV